jgi:hypothetical protein
MKFLYFENYLKISRTDKLDFFILLGAFKNFKVIAQKIILDCNALLLEFSEDSDMEFATKTFVKFFEDIEQKESFVNIKKVEQILQDKSQMVLTFEDKQEKRIKL